jgi:cytochrome c-type biogenesis protein CcmH/NrfF
MGEEDDNNQYEDAEEKWQEHQVETNMRYEMNNKAIEDRQTRIENQMDSLMGKISELIEQGQNSMAKDTGARQ